MTTEVRIRKATTADIDRIAHHRVTMFTDMGRTTPESLEPLRQMTREYLLEATSKRREASWQAMVDALRLELMRLMEQDETIERAVEDYCWGV